MTSVRHEPDRRLLGELLIEAGLLTRDGLAAGLEEQRLRGGRLGFALMKTGRVVPAAFHLFLQDNMAHVSPELAEALRRGPAVDWIPAHLAHHYGMVPVRAEDGVLDLAVSGADSPALIPAVQELTGLKVEPLVCPPSLIALALERFYPSEVEPGVVYRSAGDNLLVLSDRPRGLLPGLPEGLSEGAPPSEWLRAIAAEAVRRRARRITIEPHPEEMRVIFRGGQGEETGLSSPRSVYPGVAKLLEGLARIASRGRVVPRDGRVALSIDGRILTATVTALGGFDGETYALDLRDERVLAPSAETLRFEMPGLVPVVERLAAHGRGLFLLVGPGAAEMQAALDALLALLGDRLQPRISLADWARGSGIETIGGTAEAADAPFEARLDRALAMGPGLLVLAGLDQPGAAEAAIAQAEERAVVAHLKAPDAFAAAELLGRLGLARAAQEALAGILAARLMEILCFSCRRPYDLHEILSPGPRERAIPPGPYYASAGCALCHGSGVRTLEPVFEFLAGGHSEGLFQPGVGAGRLREERMAQGAETLLRAALRKAAAGVIDVREPLRLLLHEPR